MASYFRPARCVELSILDYIETNLNTDWTGTTIVKTFKQAYDTDVSLPIVCIRLASVLSSRKEVGNTALEDRFLIMIDIFTRSDAQRLDMADYIETKLSTGGVYYTFSHASGDNTTLSKTSAGRWTVTDWITNERIDVGDSSDPKDRYRHVISIQVRKDVT